MGSRYLTDLASVIRSTGLQVYEESNWQTRARSSGGFNSPDPCAIIVHHTASNTSRQNDVNYMCYNSSDRPIANLLLDRAGAVTVMAAGATNTNGKGGPLGPLSLDNANSRVIGIEAANNGTGENWPAVQQDAYITLVKKLCSTYSIPTNYVYSHAEWAPTRKVDPAGPSRWASSPVTNPWNMTSFRAELKSAPVEGGSDTSSISAQDLRNVLNEGAPFGTGADPDFPGKPWAEGNVNMAGTIQDVYNYAKRIEDKVDSILKQLEALETEVRESIFRLTSVVQSIKNKSK